MNVLPIDPVLRPGPTDWPAPVALRHVHEVHKLEIFQVPYAGGPKLLVQARGEATTTGWEDAQLSPRFYDAPPSDGLWEFDFLASPPSGPVAVVAQAVEAVVLLAMPRWCCGARVYAATNHIGATDLGHADVRCCSEGTWSAARSLPGEQHRVPLAAYEHQFDPAPHGSSRRRRHELGLTLRGADGVVLRRGLLAAAASPMTNDVRCSFAQGGPALDDAVTALLGWLRRELGPAVEVSVSYRCVWVAG